MGMQMTHALQLLLLTCRMHLQLLGVRGDVMAASSRCCCPTHTAGVHVAAMSQAFQGHVVFTVRRTLCCVLQVLLSGRRWFIEPLVNDKLVFVQ